MQQNDKIWSQWTLGLLCRQNGFLRISPICLPRSENPSKQWSVSDVCWWKLYKFCFWLGLHAAKWQDLVTMNTGITILCRQNGFLRISQICFPRSENPSKQWSDLNINFLITKWTINSNWRYVLIFCASLRGKYVGYFHIFFWKHQNYLKYVLSASFR